jgi:hypothetical protein
MLVVVDDVPYARLDHNCDWVTVCIEYGLETVSLLEVLLG